MSIERDMNALRGLYDRDPKARTMDDIALSCGENMYPAIARMIDGEELVSYTHNNHVYYAVGPNMKAYRL